MFNAGGTFHAGKYKGINLRSPDVEPNYLRWMYWHLDLGDAKDRVIVEELRRRGEPPTDRSNNQEARDEKRGTAPSRPLSRALPPQTNLSLLLEIVAAGRQSLSKRHHPDVGGDGEMMKQVNVTADYAEEWLRGMGAGK